MFPEIHESIPRYRFPRHKSSVVGFHYRSAQPTATILIGDQMFPKIQMSQSPVTDSLEIILTNITEKLV
ncbi:MULTISPECIES: hypothetical protein [unclassified Microcystis]|uniref:hypothetical protein n=1 Tax=unclassified Microcystis TaxID=2643300 RepID=UPI0022C30EFA|nr:MULTISPECIES: hypothetical protein [unclassified Microcystis]MCZ8222534.1 hypothetical protein [Microcystis sp. LE19-84.1B]